MDVLGVDEANGDAKHRTWNGSSCASSGGKAWESLGGTFKFIE